jgi:hypothetical protein
MLTPSSGAIAPTTLNLRHPLDLEALQMCSVPCHPLAKQTKGCELQTTNDEDAQGFDEKDHVSRECPRAS